MKIEDVLIDKFNLKVIKKPSRLNVFHIYAGFISEYPIIVSYIGFNSGCDIHISADKEMLENHASILIEKLNSMDYLSDIKTIDSYISLKVASGVFSKKKLALALEETIDSILAYFKLNSILPGDFLIGDYDNSIALYKTGQTYLYLTNESKEMIEKKLGNTESEKKKVKTNIPRGILGAILGAFVGAIIFTTISFFIESYIYFSGIIFIFTYLGYKYMGKNEGLLVGFLSLIISVLFLYPSIFIRFNFTSYEVLKPSPLDVTTIKNLFSITFYSIQESNEMRGYFSQRVTDGTEIMAISAMFILGFIVFPIQSQRYDETIIRKIE